MVDEDAAAEVAADDGSASVGCWHRLIGAPSDRSLLSTWPRHGNASSNQEISSAIDHSITHLRTTVAVTKNNEIISFSIQNRMRRRLLDRPPPPRAERARAPRADRGERCSSPARVRRPRRVAAVAASRPSCDAAGYRGSRTKPALLPPSMPARFGRHRHLIGQPEQRARPSSAAAAATLLVWWCRCLRRFIPCSCGSCGATRLLRLAQQRKPTWWACRSQGDRHDRGGVRLLRPSTREIKPRSDRAFDRQ